MTPDSHVLANWPAAAGRLPRTSAAPAMPNSRRVEGHPTPPLLIIFRIVLDKRTVAPSLN